MTRELKNIEASVKRRLYNLANKEKQDIHSNYNFYGIKG